MKVAVLGLAALVACSSTTTTAPDGGGSADQGVSKPVSTTTIFVAVEDQGQVAAVEANSGKLLGKASLQYTSQDGHPVGVLVHNVQGAPDGRLVWATGNMNHGGGGHTGHENEPDQLVGIDPTTYAVKKRIPLGVMAHLAHVVLGNGKAYVTATEANVVFEVDLAAGSILRKFALPAKTGPHGARLTPDGKQLVVAGMTDGSIQLVDLADGKVTTVDVDGIAVQAAVLPDGSAAFVTLFDKKQVARLDLKTRELKTFDLPSGAVGPLQLYPTADSKQLWVADQGVLNGAPTGDSLYRLNATTGAVELTAKVGKGPHGVVVEEHGSRVWITNMVDSTLQSVDATSGKVLSTVEVGPNPNGVTCLHPTGAMP
ncbi:MAG: YncE family protein [Deltaproteobacteria bacterium]|nr:YncE family protein [Deltaproteobacteria bacterium]